MKTITLMPREVVALEKLIEKAGKLYALNRSIPQPLKHTTKRSKAMAKKTAKAKKAKKSYK